MKNFIVTLICFLSTVSFAQMTMKKLDGTPINTGDVFAFNVLGDSSLMLDPDPAYFGYKIYNSSNSAISVKMKCMSISGGATGTNLQFCIDPICIGSITVGSFYPSDMSSIIPANGSNGNFDHFINFDGGNGTDTVDYVLKFYMVGSFGEEIGTPITLTYRYDPNLSVNDINQLQSTGVVVKNTLVDSMLNLDILRSTGIYIYDMNGKTIYKSNLEHGIQSIDLSNLNSGTYIVGFSDSQGNTSSQKIIKR